MKTNMVACKTYFVLVFVPLLLTFMFIKKIATKKLLN